MRQLEAEFHSRGPWVTGYEISGEVYGGEYLAETDKRLEAFFEVFPEPGHVLELGCLEGGHTLALAKRSIHVVGIDSRAVNLDKARWVQQLTQRENVTFLEANLEDFDLESLGSFDVIFNVGLLYHLPEPWELLRRIRKVSEHMFLWTHVAPDEMAGVERGGYWGMTYQEHGLEDPLSGMSRDSFWPTVDELVRILADAGYTRNQLITDDQSHPHGPAVLMHCHAV